jgi:hypothetical protein
VSVTSDSFAPPPNHEEWTEAVELNVTSSRATHDGPSAFVAESIEDIQWLLDNTSDLPSLRAIVAGHIPAAAVSILSGLGILALRADEAGIARLTQAKVLRVPARTSWEGDALSLIADEQQIDVEWLARGAERQWTSKDE